MIIEGPKLRGVFVSRPNRFLALVRIDQQLTPCYLPDPGRLKELLQPGVEVLLRKPPTASPPHKYKSGSTVEREPDFSKGRNTRKTKHDVFAVILKEGKSEKLISVDTRLPNRLVLDALLRRQLEEFQEYEKTKPEFSYGSSRLDFLLERQIERDRAKCLLEVKSCNLSVGGVALFPDAPTERGRRHVEELIKAKTHREYERACILFIVQRDDAERLEPYAANDRKFADTLHNALAKGVEAYAHTLKISEDEITLFRSIPVKA